MNLSAWMRGRIRALRLVMLHPDLENKAHKLLDEAAKRERHLETEIRTRKERLSRVEQEHLTSHGIREVARWCGPTMGQWSVAEVPISDEVPP